MSRSDVQDDGVRFLGRQKCLLAHVHLFLCWECPSPYLVGLFSARYEYQSQTHFTDDSQYVLGRAHIVDVWPDIASFSRVCVLNLLSSVEHPLWREAGSVLCKSQPSHLSVCTFTIYILYFTDLPYPYIYIYIYIYTRYNTEVTNRVGRTQLGSFCWLITNQSNNTRENGKVPFVVDRWQLSIRQFLIINNQSIQQHTGKWESTFCCR
jgi:hypothetical protein